MKKCFNCGHEIEDGDYCEKCGAPLSEGERQPVMVNDSKKRALSYGTGIIYPVILVFLSFLLWGNGIMTLGLFALASLLAIAGGFFIIFGGLYFIVIPLPIIFLYRIGVVDKNQSRARIIIYSILAGASMIISIAIVLAHF